jgi:uncharacterized membrane protein
VSGVETIARGDDSRLVEPRRFLLRDPIAFRAVWAAHAGPDAPAPPVDFESRMVAAVFAGERPGSGYQVDIRATRHDGPVLEILVDETPPDSQSATEQILVSPFHIVARPRHDGEIRFSTQGPWPPAATIIFNREPHPRITPDQQPITPDQPPITPDQPRITRSTRIGSETASSTGLTPQVAAALAYLAGPFSGMLLLATERSNRFVRFHAWQAVLALGVVGVAAVCSLLLAFALLIVSPTAFWAMLWLAALSGVAWVILWALCLLQAYKGRLWKLPLAGDLAERYASS